VDFRLLAATNVNPEALVKSGQLRRDLFYRLNVVAIQIPPLRERREDIPAIARHRLAVIRDEQGIRPLEISPEVLAILQRYDWPGNVRELHNVLERAACAAEGLRIEIGHLPLFLQEAIGGREREQPRSSLRLAMREAEREAVLKALSIAKGNKARAAKLLGIHRTGLYQKLVRLNIVSGVPERQVIGMSK
jgi:transcriptional regulator with PAS, ATPase and Fis domain